MNIFVIDRGSNLFLLIFFVNIKTYFRLFCILKACTYFQTNAWLHHSENIILKYVLKHYKQPAGFAGHSAPT